MWITLLFIAQVGCEWVQISQHHYRKQYRPYNHPVLAEEDYEYEEDTTTPKPNTMYTNQSLIDYKWIASDIPYNKGFITKVEADDAYLIRDDKKTGLDKVNKAIKKNNYHDEDLESYFNRDDNDGLHKPVKEPINNAEAIVSTVKPHSDKYGAVSHGNLIRYEPDRTESGEDIFEESYHVIPNTGSIKKVHLDSRTVRTPIQNEKSRKHYETSSTHNIKPLVSERGHFPSRPVIIWKGDDNQTKKVVPGIIEKVSKEDLKQIAVENISRYEEIPLNDDHSKIKKIFMTHIVENNEGISGETVKTNQFPDINFEKPVFVTKEEFDDDAFVTISIDDNTARTEKTTESIKKPTTEIPKSKIKNNTEDLPTKDKVNTMENVLKFMRIVTDTISRNTRRSVGSKVRYLENLQNTIMANIEHRINTLWPDDDSSSKPSRKTRSATARGGGHVEFPSSESALMTISFLTFAVYLIKLVLQVIHTYKNKAMLMTPAVVTTVGRNIAAVIRRTEIP